MVEGQDNPKLTEAKEAVKQQLLRAIVKQATDELYASSEDEIISRLSEIPTTDTWERMGESIQSRIMTSAVDQVASRLPGNEDSWAEIAGKAVIESDQFEQAVDHGVAKALEKIEHAITERVASTMPDVDEIYQKMASKIDVEAAWVDDLAKNIEGQWRGRLVSDLATRVKQGLNDSSDLTAQALSILTSDEVLLDSAEAEILENMAEVAAERALKSLGDSDHLVRSAEKHIDLDSKAFGQAIHATREMLAGLVADHALAGATKSGYIRLIGQRLRPFDGIEGVPGSGNPLLDNVGRTSRQRYAPCQCRVD